MGAGDASQFTRNTVKVPVESLPVVDSSAEDAPLTVRAVLPLASPLTVRSLACLTVVFTLFRRVMVPVTEMRVLMLFVVTVSNADCAAPLASA